MWKNRIDPGPMKTEQTLGQWRCD